jgi:lipopolysaccharide biosynthesis glycosyltransferase
MDFEGNYFIACTHTRKLLTNLNKARLGVKNDVPYINTGVMLLNLGELRNNVSLDSMQRFAHRKRLSLMLPDQDIITALYGTKIKLADTMRFNLSDRILGFYNADIKNKRRNINWVRQNTAIIHYCGKNKPWKNNYTGKLGVFYHELLQEVRIKNAG